MRARRPARRPEVAWRTVSWFELPGGKNPLKVNADTSRPATRRENEDRLLDLEALGRSPVESLVDCAAAVDRQPCNKP